MRLSIKPHNQEFLTNLAAQAGCTETDILNHLLLEMKLDSIFGTDKVSTQNRAIASSVQASVSQPVPAFPAIEVPDYLPTSVMQEIDPIIERMASLIENF